MTRRRSPRPSLIGLTAAAVLVVTACGGGSGSESEATVPATADLVVRAVPTIKWDKDAYTAPAGEIEVALVNEDSVRHDLVVLDGDTKVGDLELIVRRSGDIETGTITLDPGTYSIFCIVPGHGNMKSELTVT